MLGEASAHGVHATVVRIGQACGPKATGAWSISEWVPILVKSSITLGYFPALPGVRCLLRYRLSS